MQNLHAQCGAQSALFLAYARNASTGAFLPWLHYCTQQQGQESMRIMAVHFWGYSLLQSKYTSVLNRAKACCSAQHNQYPLSSARLLKGSILLHLRETI